MSLSKLIDKTIDKAIADIQLGMICKIVSFDKSKMRADVQPLFKIKNDNDEEMTLPIIPDIPVLNYSGGGYYIRPFYEKDDLVWVGFSTYDIQNALQGYTRAASEKKFELHNGCVLGGIYKDNDSMPGTFGNDGLLFGCGDGTFILMNKTDGIKINSAQTIQVKNSAQNMKLLIDGLFSLLDGFITVGSSSTQNTSPATKALIAAEKIKWGALLKE